MSRQPETTWTGSRSRGQPAPLGLLLGVVVMISFIALSTRRNRGTMSRERAERLGLRGTEGLAHAEERHEERG